MLGVVGGAAQLYVVPPMTWSLAWDEPAKAVRLPCLTAFPSQRSARELGGVNDRTPRKVNLHRPNDA